jgi:hypothetical protein
VYQHPVATEAAPICVTVAGSWWQCLVPHRWQNKALLQAKLYDMINNQGSATVLLTLNQDESIKKLRSYRL